ncbi:30S ribosomal protein S6 [Ferrovibrio sp.]|uniref:30S ribosomal protein S6 n=1 Tax=Ferrovibrio sp. TaxID=1917215 RepID=UPI0025BEF338|nr:30S ribosomal protein S6 [Ferrovibrio sp.]MBX3455872.1 30S ribosomal protein S6 [Ferrovibrio sp.]
MAFYENVFIARQDISTAQVEALTAQFSEIIKGQGGEVGKTENWGLRNLTYRIKKNKKGHYVLMNITASGAAVAELERNMRINEDILRYMTVRVEGLEDGPSIMLQNKNREDRPRREGDRFGDRDRGDRFGDRGDRGERRPRIDRDDVQAETE